MYSVYQHWDPLKVCVVGRSYPPEFYSWIKKTHVRKLFEKIAIETEEDYQNVISKLESFGVKVLRPTINLDNCLDPTVNTYIKPPMTPRDHMVMIGEKFYHNPGLDSTFFIEECYSNIIDHIKEQDNKVVSHFDPQVNGAMVSRIGKDLYFGTTHYNQFKADPRLPFYNHVFKFMDKINKEFCATRNHIINTGGHSDGTYCPVCPGLIISLYDVPEYTDTYPGWEVVYLPGQSWAAVREFLELKTKNNGKWWIPGFEHDQDVIDLVEIWLKDWVGYVEETVFDVNMLIVDPKNVIVFNYNKQVFDAFSRYGITPHIVPFRHRYFWDGGIHCITSDLHRDGTMQDYFPNRAV